jgi:hypothetical protein
MTILHDQWTALYDAGKVRWMMGMQDLNGNRVLLATADKFVGMGVPHGGYFDTSTEHLLPDFADPATLGCLLHQAREAWGRPCFTVARARVDGMRMWRVVVSDDCITDPLDSEPEAILDAIAAAPPKVTE